MRKKIINHSNHSDMVAKYNRCNKFIKDNKSNKNNKFIKSNNINKYNKYIMINKNIKQI